jgi:thiol-disulfide isomerase/thioredoxin
MAVTGLAAASSPDLWPIATDYAATVRGPDASPVRVFTSPDYRKLLLVPEKGKTAYILLLKTSEAQSVPRQAITFEKNGARLDGGARKTALGSFTRKEANIDFRSGSLEIHVGPAATLTGETTLSEILEQKPGYRQKSAEYQPDAAAVAALRRWSRPAEIFVFFGTWCPVCGRRVPMFMKTIEAAANPNLRVRYIAIDEKYSNPADLIRSHSVHITPTFIVKVDGREIGRINKKPKTSLEKDLADIFESAR